MAPFIIDRYILRHFFKALLVVTVAIGFTIIVINMVDELRDFIDHEVPLLTILEYYAYFAGWTIKSFFPLFVLLAGLFSVSILARRNEVLAMKANGLSLYRVTLPLFAVALILSAGHFTYNEYIFPPANQRRLEIKKFSIERRSREAQARVAGVRRQISPGNFYTVGVFNTLDSQGTDFRLYSTTANQLTRIVTARKVMFKDNQWLAIEGVERMFADAAEKQFLEFDTLHIAAIEDTPDDLAKRLGRAEDLSLDEIRYYIDLMKRTGGPYIEEAVNLQLKYAYPLTSAIVILICVPFAANPKRGGIAVSFAVGAIIALVYFVLFKIAQSAGYNEKIPIWVAAWGINSVFFLIGLGVITRARK
jgi:lipopolysaccharide export system permease protein